ncbi:hypothetical protein MJO28_000889 [Puccinia striiformis f. sp. tritici]|uniref:Uncharacterized protein n=4 Tax=Puccinia striiformis TaxID=27350 RepID=A0A0L0VRD5_9BASI|nr:hypothetical protein Pst134EA_000357 [Puccinia striiformis f. sp. tritici]KAI9601399.1 hypothetical protein H4Q26_001217 [Puccinia striiformis f. sp. tritici PST-130]KNF01777.1 hypothetical protein PSTG_04898 [Puccinia striiformis f. sp. tritici PST-78]POW14085.1 hypothetical protein PSHT_07524 [Puccinia striiformis]KAH9466525.1 hypothetical protein Pst134EB_001578 [Puccinia striiformis f. sp. tritici]KAH9473283.1 hypothetical protein Pst134EA_000357 [Puccinia striiformis f. sp. tritici]
MHLSACALFILFSTFVIGCYCPDPEPIAIFKDLLSQRLADLENTRNLDHHPAPVTDRVQFDLKTESASVGAPLQRRTNVFLDSIVDKKEKLVEKSPWLLSFFQKGFKLFFAPKGEAYKNFQDQGGMFLPERVFFLCAFLKSQDSTSRAANDEIQSWAREHLHTDYLQGLAKIEEIYDQHFLNNDLSRSERRDRKLKVKALAGSVNTTLLRLAFRYINSGGRKRASTSNEAWFWGSAQILSRLTELQDKYPEMKTWSEMNT